MNAAICVYCLCLHFIVEWDDMLESGFVYFFSKIEKCIAGDILWEECENASFDWIFESMCANAIIWMHHG